MNFDALKKRLQSLNESTQKKGDSKGSKNYWKPTGKHVIRILPDLGNDESPFINMYFYYELTENRRPITSPVSFGKPDPILEFAKYLQRTGVKEDWVKGKKLEPKERPHVKIIVRGEEEQGPFYWGFSPTTNRELLNIMLDPDYGDITHPTTGRDITVEFIPAANEGSYSKVTILPKPNQSVLTEDPALLSAIQNMPSLEQITEVPTYDELKVILENYLGVQNVPQPQTAPVTPPKVDQGLTSHTSPVTAVDAFDQLFKKS